MNITKLSLIFTISVIFNIFFQTVLVMFGFNILRRTASGIHAETSMECNVLSVVMFVILPFLFKDVTLIFWYTPIIGVIIFVILLLFAPADTKKIPIIGKEKRKRLKRISLITCFCLFVFLTLFPISYFQTMVILGATYEAILILPITYRILGREANNYGRYENS